MTAAIISFSAKGFSLGEKIAAYLRDRGDAAGTTRCGAGGLTAWTAENFTADALVFIGSCGIAVRAIAPHVADKTADPAVVVVDELGAYAVSLLSGHLGGANEVAADLARFLGAIPVITTATDVNGVFAVDAWAARQGLRIANPARIKWISARLLAGDTVTLQTGLPVTGTLPKGVIQCEQGADILITHRTRGREEALRLVPPAVTLGVGCKKGVTAGALEAAYQMMLGKGGCHPLAVARVCSIDLKKDEPGILEFCARNKLPFQTFSAGELMAVRGRFASSPFVAKVTGTDNVCERAAVLGSGPGGRLMTEKDAGNGITMALAIAPYPICFEEDRP